MPPRVSTVPTNRERSLEEDVFLHLLDSISRCNYLWNQARTERAMADATYFPNEATRDLAHELASVPIWEERPITFASLYGDHIRRMGWQELCCPSARLGNMRLTQEFFASLPFAVCSWSSS